MSFTLKDIQGAVVGKYKGFLSDEETGYNNAIDAQSSVQLRFNRDKLIMVIEKWAFDNKQVRGSGVKAGIFKPIRWGIGKLADSIIAAEKELIEVDTTIAPAKLQATKSK